MLLFSCRPADPATVPAEGYVTIRLYDTLAKAQADCQADQRVVVLERGGEDSILGAKPVNLDPYLPPKEVVAAGGYVVRQGEAGPEVLLIFRRGAWDLPKGKLDKGESVEEAARREVQEEVGLDALPTVRRSLGQTLHGYAEAKKSRYAVKTTHWFLMQTEQETFTPQADEDIEQVEYVAWNEALDRLGYESLRQHMAGIDPKSLF